MKIIIVVKVGILLLLTGCQSLSYEMLNKDFSDQEKFDYGLVNENYVAMGEGLDAGVDIDAELKSTDGGMSALIFAASTGNKSLVEYLLKNGANPNLSHTGKDQKSLSPLTGAVASGKVSVVELLLKSGADPNQGIEWDRKGVYVNSIHVLIANPKTNSSELVMLLSSYGADVDLPFPDGMPPVYRAVIEKNEGLVRALSAVGANCKAIYPKNNTMAIDEAMALKLATIVGVLKDC